MRKIYSLVLMATMLLIGTNAWAKDFTGNSSVQLQQAIIDILYGSEQDSVIKLTQPVYFGENAQTIWMGTKDMDGDEGQYKTVIIDLNGNNITWNDTENSDRKMFVLTHGELKIINKAAQEANVQLTGKAGSDSELFVVYGTYKSSRWNADGSALSADSINTRDKGWFSHLYIGENVKLYAEEGCEAVAIECDVLRNDPQVTNPYVFYPKPDGTTGIINYHGLVISNNNAAYGLSHGVCIDFKGKIDIQGKANTELGANNSKCYGIKVGGYPQSPLSLTAVRHANDIPYMGNYLTYNDPIDEAENGKTHKLDTADVPFVWVHPGAEIKVRSNGKKVTALYAVGYAKWLVQGHCEGKTGIYVGSGIMDLNDAYIKSSANAWTQPTSAGSANGGGSGAVLNSRDGGYPGDIEFTVKGDTKIESVAGYAIEEIVNTTTETVPNPKADPENTEIYDPDAPETIEVQVTKIADISIEGGTIIGGDKGAIVISESTTQAAIEAAAADPDNVDKKVTVTVYGGTVDGTTQVGSTGDLDDLIPNTTNYHTTEVTVTDPETGNEKTIIVVSQGAEPAIADPEHPENPTTWQFIAEHQGVNNSYKWTAQETNQQITSGTIKLNELQINSGTAGHLQELIIKNGAALEVNRLIMNDYARIIVKAGGKLIVKGSQGISAPSVENIKLEASETAQALFLFHPKVSSNRHPNATVEFISNSITNNPFFSKQRFGIPTWKKLSSITTKNGGNNVQTAIASYSFEAHDWVDVSWINIAGKDENLNLIANPFEYYQMQHNTPNDSTVVTMKGELYGNTNPTLSILGNSWNGYANSYMAPIDGATLIDLIPDEVDKSFQIYVLDDGAKGHWAPVSNLDLANIRPMQAFLIGNTKEAANVTVDYWDAVYTPITGESKPTPNAAPARRSALSTITKAKMIVRGEGYTDGVVLAQDDQFSAEFDNSYDCRKYMNEGINLYVSADEKMGIFATDNLENTYVGFQSVNGGSYTIEFTNVQGEELTLIDHETGAQVLMVEGNTYEFTANGANDYRFEVVTTAKIATSIENTEAVKNAKGIYTITGQYVGEMNVWNSLPAGIYVIDGAKRVK